MVKCFVTGDNHFGIPYEGKLSDIRGVLIEARYESLENMVRKANEENCDFFVITGDLFEKTDIGYIGGGNKKKGVDAVIRVIEILKNFNKTVVIIPGNHDYEDGTSTVWQEFNRQSVKYDRILVLNEFRKKQFDDVNGNEVVFYPAYCQSEHSETNNLGWIRSEEIQTNNIINIGLAHGTIEGLSCDNEGVYFKMSKKELEDIPIDVWFIGHAHIPYPKEIAEDKSTKGIKIYNAGTHQQTDIGNYSEGYCFIVEIEKEGNEVFISARKWKSGVITFHEIKVNTVAGKDDALKSELKKKIEEIKTKYDPDKSVIRVTIKGPAKFEEYGQKDSIYEELTKDFLFRYQPDWYDFFEEITPERIKDEFDENSLIAKFLNSFLTNKQSDENESKAMLNMAYGLIKKVRDGK